MSALIAALTGVGATTLLDLWALALTRGFGVKATDWAMVGRWLGHMPRGRFVQPDLSGAKPVAAEAALGWAAHYVIGAGYGLLLLVLAGRSWFDHPSVLAAMLLSWALLAAPFFVMMPGMGMGIAGAGTPSPGIARLKSLAGHTVFGLGLYATAKGLAATGFSQ
ncbi:DUF2938 family protein [Novosphingobium sp. SG707]|uniref:DUF2938 family protein n=1 Tax=Novosphingobium sp. SG707 TaxID=2586996 RepID=UPI00144591CE|nr:DUF2938 family protein [Novosphingobium sp. SG707]NKJ02031.1 hypothetical protein [Novosphingobium sp. SG707]